VNEEALAHWGVVTKNKQKRVVFILIRNTVLYQKSSNINDISISCYIFFPFLNNNYYNYFETTLYLLFVSRSLSALLFLCIHVLPDDG